MAIRTLDVSQRSTACIACVVGDLAMYTVDLSLVELGIHQELVAYVADQQDYDAEEGVHVALRDGRAWDMGRLRRTATTGLTFRYPPWASPSIPRTSRRTTRPSPRECCRWVAEELAVARVRDATTIYRT